MKKLKYEAKLDNPSYRMFYSDGLKLAINKPMLLMTIF